jgi:hypothetical protein
VPGAACRRKTGDAIFESTGPAKVVAAGDSAPDVGGAVKKLGGQHRQDGSRASGPMTRLSDCGGVVALVVAGQASR